MSRSIVVFLAVFILGLVALLLIDKDNESDVVEGGGNAIVADATIALPPEGLSNFELGQYYFNHDDNSAGQYDLKLARKYYTEALREDSRGNNLTWYQLGRIDFIEGKFLSALYKFDKQIEYFGDYPYNVYYSIGLTYGYKARKSDTEEDWMRGEEGFLKFLEFEPWSPWARTDLTWLYFMQGKYEAMIPVLEEGLTYKPDHAWLNNMYGLALLNIGDKEGAREHFVLARESAQKLTTADWGQAYPGNDPANWPKGLNEFRTVIDRNIELVAEKDGE